MLYLYPYSAVSKSLQLCQPNSHRLCFPPRPPLLRTGSDETDGQETGEDGHHAGSPAAAHPATGPAAAGPRGSQDPSAPHARYRLPPSQRRPSWNMSNMLCLLFFFVAQTLFLLLSLISSRTGFEEHISFYSFVVVVVAVSASLAGKDPSQAGRPASLAL